MGFFSDKSNLVFGPHATLAPIPNDQSKTMMGTVGTTIFTQATAYGQRWRYRDTATSGTFIGVEVRAESASATASTQVIEAINAIAVANASLYVSGCYGIRAGVIFKDSATQAALVPGSFALGWACAGWFKVEDARATDGTSTAPTYGGMVSVLRVEGQISADPTSNYYAIAFDCQATQGGVSTSQPWDALFHLFGPGGENEVICSFLKTGATLAQFGSTSTVMISSGTLTNSNSGDVYADGRLRLDLGGTSYWIPLFNTAP